MVQFDIYSRVGIEVYSSSSTVEVRKWTNAGLPWNLRINGKALPIDMRPKMSNQWVLGKEARDWCVLTPPPPKKMKSQRFWSASNLCATSSKAQVSAGTSVELCNRCILCTVAHGAHIARCRAATLELQRCVWRNLKHHPVPKKQPLSVEDVHPCSLPKLGIVMETDWSWLTVVWHGLTADPSQVIVTRLLKHEVVKISCKCLHNF